MCAYSPSIYAGLYGHALFSSLPLTLNNSESSVRFAGSGLVRGGLEPMKA